MLRLQVIIFLLISLFTISIVNAQPANHQLSKPFSHEKKVYLDEKAKKLYWPMALPFYVRLSASPEDGAPSFLLDQVSPDAKSNTKVDVSEGIQLEIPGRQFIRWFNYVTEEELMLKFYADGDAPKSSEAFVNAPIFTSGKNTFYGKGLQCNVSSEDDFAGVEKTYYSIDGRAFAAYTEALKFNTEKNVNLRYYAVDKVGNASKSSTVLFTVDLTNPVSTHETVHNFSSNTLSPSTTIKLSSTDAISGVQNIYYFFDDQASPSVYKGANIKLDHLSDGIHTLHYYAIDQVENREATIDYVFYMDKTPSVPEIAVVGDKYPDKSGDFVSPRSTITLSAADNKIGVDYIEYKINKDKFLKYGGPFVAPFNTGLFTVGYRTADRLANLSQTKKRNFQMDFTPPTSSFKITGPSLQKQSVIWMTNDTDISFSSKDDGAGVQKIEYQIGTDALVSFEKPFRIPNEGQYLTRYWSTDNVNNRIENEALLLIVDNSPPEIIESFSLTPTDSISGKNGETINVYPRFLSIFFAGIDRSVGIESIKYSINGGEEVEYGSPLLFKKDGTYRVKVMATDYIGNTTSKNFTVAVRN
ncbi:MAG: hypothetical protein HN757_09370 [Calditrichaeota bacterium]|nr:hypothetical protein [Calditrichota bacterium]